MLSDFLRVLRDKELLNRFLNPPDMYNFDILFAFLQFIGINDQKAHELAQTCVDTISFQGVIDYLSVLLQLERE